jgi:uncharacterized membrane protein
MELCILKFDGSKGADDALSEVLDVEGAENPWLLDVGVVARPLIGRVRFGLTFPDGNSKTLREGDLADAVAEMGGLTGYYLSSLAGPFGSMFGAVNAALDAGAKGSAMEERLLHLEELKKALPRNSSALVFLGDSRACDAMVELFSPYGPEVVRRDATDELRQRLEAIHERLAQEMARSVQAESAPATT